MWWNRKWHRSLLDTLEQAETRGICLYGAGFWGEIAYEIFEKMGRSPLCFCDDNKGTQGTVYHELPVYSLKETVRRYPDAIYIVCVDMKQSREQFNHMLQQLKEYGVYDSHSELRIMMYIFLLDIDSIMMTVEKEEIERIKASEINNLLILNHMSDSGSWYLEQLLDGHSNILSLPYGGRTFWIAYENRLKDMQGKELLIEMMAQMLGYFHSKYENLLCVREHKFDGYCVNENGEFIYDVLIDPGEFWKCLKEQFDNEIKLNSFGHMMKIYVAAYNNCLGKKKNPDSSYWLFYHMHVSNFDVTDLKTMFDEKEFDRLEHLFIIREPVQHCFSYIRRIVIKGRMAVVLKKNEDFIQSMKSEMGCMLEKKEGYENIKAIRFEDLKYQQENTMRSLCHWLQIPYDALLQSTTLNGTMIYFPAYEGGKVKYITGNDTTAVAQKDFSEVLTLWDEARLNIICSKFKKAYGYECEAPDFMEYRMEWLEGLLKENFRFCSIVQDVLEECGPKSDIYDVNEFVKSLYLDFMKNYQKDTQYYDYIKPEEDKE